MNIQTNTSASIASYNLSRNNQDHQRNLVRLSSGLRINAAYDDAAGLAVSMKMSAAIRRAQNYDANFENSRSFLETQDGALRQMAKLLERMSELKSLAHDETKNDGDLLLFENEYIKLQDEFKTIAAEEFNGIKLFSPSTTPEHLYLENPERGDQIQISRPSLENLHTGNTLNVAEYHYSVVRGAFTWSQARANAVSRGGHLATITSEAEWQIIQQKAPTALSSGLWIGAFQKKFSNEPAGNWEWVTGEPWAFTKWRSGEPDNSRGVEHYAFKFAGTSVWNDNNDRARGDGYLLEKPVVHIRDLPWSDLQATIMQVAQARAQNGAEQVQLQMAADLNSTNIVNMKQALSKIQDVDIAQTASDLARTRVLVDAGTAMSAQANASQESILKLIEANNSLN